MVENSKPRATTDSDANLEKVKNNEMGATDNKLQKPKTAKLTDTTWQMVTWESPDGKHTENRLRANK